MSEFIKGVNLGGWLILEKWMTPSLFNGYKGEDEFEFMQNKDASSRLKKHRDTFITEYDFKWLSDHNINLVRIPVGYWLFETIDGLEPSIKYLDSAMEWAERHNIKVLIDMHGAKGSQNGKNHSGKAGEIGWFKHASNKSDTKELLIKVAKRYKDSKALFGIELLNEPQAVRHYFSLLKFYRSTYRALCNILRPNTAVIFHDGFHALLFSGAIRARKGYPVYMDIHWYAFYPFGKSAKAYRKILFTYRSIVLKIARMFQPVIIGEWSSVFPGKYFDQIKKNEHNDLLEANINIQLKLYSYADGWIYWNYKHEGGGMWNFRSLVEQKIFDTKQGIGD